MNHNKANNHRLKLISKFHLFYNSNHNNAHLILFLLKIIFLLIRDIYTKQQRLIKNSNHLSLLELYHPDLFLHKKLGNFQNQKYFQLLPIEFFPNHLNHPGLYLQEKPIFHIHLWDINFFLTGWNNSSVNTEFGVANS